AQRSEPAAQPEPTQPPADYATARSPASSQTLPASKPSQTRSPAPVATTRQTTKVARVPPSPPHDFAATGPARSSEPRWLPHTKAPAHAQSPRCTSRNRGPNAARFPPGSATRSESQGRKKHSHRRRSQDIASVVSLIVRKSRTNGLSF